MSPFDATDNNYVCCVTYLASKVVDLSSDEGGRDEQLCEWLSLNVWLVHVLSENNSVIINYFHAVAPNKVTSKRTGMEFVHQRFCVWYVILFLFN